MDFTASSATWIHASNSGDPLNTDDTSATISQHDGAHDAFTWKWASAKGGDSVNPFQSSSSATPTKTGSAGASRTSSCVSRPTTGTATPTSYSGYRRSLFGEHPGFPGSRTVALTSLRTELGRQCQLLRRQLEFELGQLQQC